MDWNFHVKDFGDYFTVIWIITIIKTQESFCVCASNVGTEVFFQ